MAIGLQDIFSSLYRFTSMYEEERNAMTNWWYAKSGRDIARVFKHMPGNKIIANCRNLKNWEYIADRLLLVADAVAIRDLRGFTEEHGFVIHPEWTPYDRSSIENLPLPAVGRDLAQHQYWSSTVVDVPMVGQAPVAMAIYDGFPEDAYQWIHGKGRDYHATGSVFYAPFIPPLEVELEFMKNRVSMANLIGGESLFSESIDFVDENALLALASINLPTLENVPLTTLQKIKADHHDDFSVFSRAMVKAVTGIKSSAGSEQFLQDARAIQRDLLDDNLDKLAKKYKQISRMRSLSAGGVFVGTVGLSFAAISGAAVPAIITGLAASVAAGIAHAASQFKEKYSLSENPMNFLWRVNQNARK